MIQYLMTVIGLNGLFADEEGATAIEYALIAGLIALAIVAAVALLGHNVTNIFHSAAKEVGGAGEQRKF